MGLLRWGGGEAAGFSALGGDAASRRPLPSFPAGRTTGRSVFRLPPTALWPCATLLGPPSDLCRDTAPLA